MKVKQSLQQENSQDKQPAPTYRVSQKSKLLYCGS